MRVGPEPTPNEKTARAPALHRQALALRSVYQIGAHYVKQNLGGWIAARCVASSEAPLQRVERDAIEEVGEIRCLKDTPFARRSAATLSLKASLAAALALSVHHKVK